MTEAVTLVIPGKNASSTLRPCLDAVVPLLQRGELTEILFIDDGSTDDTKQIAASYPVRILDAPRKGPGGARNVGWRAANTPLVWFIDSDCVAEPDALQRLRPHLEDPKVAAVSGSYLNRLPDSLLACLIQAEIEDRHQRMGTEVDFLASFNVLYRRSVLELLGGFDEADRYNAAGSPGAEDAELAYRAFAAGHRLHFDIQSKVGHYHPTRLGRYLRSQRHHGYWRVNLHLNYQGRKGHDSYSNWVDHAQPPLACLTLATLPLLIFSWTCWIPAALFLLLWVLTLPMTFRLMKRSGRMDFLAYSPMGLVRAYARSFGLVAGFLARARGTLR